MRELKFRAWGKHQQSMIAPFHMDESEARDRVLNSIHGPENYVILQYTGLHDKNGCEIYEGDVIAYNGAGSIMDPGLYAVRFVNGKFYPVSEFFYKGWPKSWGTEHSCTIIGNIYTCSEPYK